MTDKVVDCASLEPCQYCAGTGNKLKVVWQKQYAHRLQMDAKTLRQFVRMIPDDTLVFAFDKRSPRDGTTNIELKIEDGDIHIVGH